MNANNTAVLAALAQNPMVIDDHGNGTRERQVRRVAIFTDGRKTDHVAMLFTEQETPYFSTNPLYLDKEDGRVHLNNASCGPTIDVRRLGGLELALEDHNVASRAWTKWDCGTFGPIITL